MYTTLRRPAAATAMAVLGLVLATAPMGAVAQSVSPDPLAPAVVTGTIDASGLTEDPGTRTATEGDTVTQVRA